MSNKILVTGATGFVGAEIVKQLVNQGKSVKALKRKTSNTQFLKDYEGSFEWVMGDVNDIPSLESAFEDVDYVYHSAAMISFDPAQKHKMFKVNIEGTANMVNISLENGIKKFLQVSSVSAFGRYDIKHPINEETKWLYNKIAKQVREANKIWGFDIIGFGEDIQIGTYTAENTGHYDWHLDIGKDSNFRKISVSDQLSDPNDYQGGELQFYTKRKITIAPKEKGFCLTSKMSDITEYLFTSVGFEKLI